jgi:hypothetical protein
MQIRIQATANLGQAQAQFAALERQVEKLNAEIARSSMVPMGGSVKGFKQAQYAARGATTEFANALAASGAFRAEQVRLPNVINKTTEALRNQKLTFSQVFGKGARDNMRAVYKEQLAMQQAFSRQVTGGVGNGRTQMTMAIPKEVPKSWDTLSNRVGFFQARLKSASTQMVNWGKQMQWSGRQLMTGLTLPVAAFGVAAGVMAYQVNKQFTRIQKVYDTTADANSTLASQMKAYATEIADLQVASYKTASNAAKEYGVSITDTLSVQADLAATGQTGAQLQAAATQVVRNATLGEIDYQTATKATIALQQQLHLSNTALADSWAYMNSVENATSLGMADFAEAIPIALAPIKQMGGDLQDLGTLMTAMVSQGVQVGKAANAIKALPGRLSNPAKTTQEMFRKLTGQDIVELNKKNPDNIIALLQSIGDATKDLDAVSKRQVLGKLFGTYQLSTMSAMLGGVNDLSKGIGQTTDAFKIGEQSAEDWRKVSDREIKAFQDSAAGKFKIAFQSIKAELAQIGDPFLDVASKFLDTGTAIFKFFNGLPSIVKKAAVLPIFLGAILGPIVMLAGLFVQLAGNVGKMFASVLNLAKGMKILSIAEHATNFESKLIEKGLINQQSEAQLLTARLEALTAATLGQRDAMAALSRTNMGASGMLGPNGSPLLPIVGKPQPTTYSPVYGNNPSPLPYKGPSIKDQIASNYVAPATTSSINSMQQAAAARAAAAAQEAAYLKTAEQVAAASGLTARNAKASEIAEARKTQEYLKQVTLGEEIMSLSGLGARNSSIAEFSEAKKTRQMLEQSKLAQEIMALTGLAAKDASVEEKFRAEQLRIELEITAQKEAQLAAARAAESATTVSRSPAAQAAQYAAAHSAAAPATQVAAIRKQQEATTVMTKAEAKAADKAAKSEAKRTASAERRLAAGKAETKVQEATTRAASGAALAGAAMAASMGLMMMTSNETANNIGKWLMIGTIAVPAVKAMGPLVAGIGSNFLSVASNAAKVGTETARTGGAIARTAGPLRVMRAGFKGVGAAALGIMGPLGWTVTALAAIGVLVYKWHQHEQDVTKEKVAQAKAMYDQNNLMESALKIQAQAPKRISIASPTDIPGQLTVGDLASQMGEDSTMKDLISSLKGANQFEEAAIMMKKYSDVLKSVGGDASKAQKYIEALYRASGTGSLEAVSLAQKWRATLGDDISNADYGKLFVNQFLSTLGDSQKEIDAQGKAMGTQLSNAMADGGQEQAGAVVATLATSLDSAWNNAFSTIDAPTKKAIAKYGFNTGEELRKAIEGYQNFSKNGDESAFKAMLPQGSDIEDAITVMQMMGDSLQGYNNLTSGLLGSEREMVKVFTDQLGLSKDITTLAQLRATYEFQLATATKGNAKSLYDQRVAYMANARSLGGILDYMGDMTDAQKLSIANQILLQTQGVQANSLTDALALLMGKVADKTDDAANAANKLKSNLGAIKFSITGDQAKTALQNTFKAVQSQMAEMASGQLEAQATASAAQVQSYWDHRADQLDAAQEAQSKRLEEMQQKAQDRFDAAQQKAQDIFDAGQEKAARKFSRKQEQEQERFDKRWERRKNAVQNASDARIAGIQNEIDAEQKADDARQAMFEAEQKRIDRLAQSANQGIDFNIALSTGNIDEAAKLQNDMAATAGTRAVEDGKARSDAASQKKIDDLQKVSDAIKSQTDLELAELDKAEQAATKSFQRRQERAQRHFQKIQEMEQRAFAKSQEMEQRRFQKSQELQQEALAKTQERAKKALDQQTANAVAANAAEYAARKASLDKQLALFTAFTVSSKAQLDKWMAKTGLSYSDFGVKSGDWFNKAFKEQLRVEGAALGSDSMWANLGADVAKQTIKGMGFGGLKGFAHFIKTGQLPDNFGKANKPTTPAGVGGNNPDRPHAPTPGQQNHGGGLIGEGGTGRKGVARTTKGVGPGERLVLARDKEFMVNEQAAQKHLPLLKAINSGHMNASRGNISPGGEGGSGVNPGLGGFAAGLAGAAIAAGGAAALTAAYNAKMAQSSGGTYSSLGGGTFGDSGNFNAEQLKNAAIIASVGSSLGMSSRDIEIGIMTAIAESSLINTSGGDRDSVGLFQQRTSQGWGSVEQIMDPNYAATQFFNHLKGISGRESMAPWLAAQAVQRSAFSDGSNYHQWWDEAQDIFKRGLVQTEAGGYNTSGLVGAGGKARPSIPGKGWFNNNHDYLNGLGSPVYAFNDGVISKSMAIHSGGTPAPAGNPYGSLYSSYGEVIEVTAHDGNSVLAAHLAPGTSSKWSVGDPVAGGTLLGLSDQTGNATGPHTHFEHNGNENDAKPFFSRYGISLDTTGPLRNVSAGGGGGANAYEDAGVDPGGAWTYGDLPGMEGYDPYTAMNEWIAAQAEAAAAAAAAQTAAERRAARLARKAQRDALTAAIAAEQSNLDIENAEIARLKAKPHPDKAKIDTAQWIRNQIKARLEAAQAALVAWREANQAQEDDAAAAATPTKSKTSTLRTGTYNMLFSSPNSDSMSDLSRLFGMTDVLSLTEFAGEKQKLAPWINNNGWGIAGTGENVVAYNKNKYSASKTGSIQLNKTEGESLSGKIGVGGARRLDAAYTMLSGSDGSKFWQVAAHTIAHIWKNPTLNRKVQQEQFGSLGGLATRLGKDGTPVFVGGDFNNDPRNIEGSRPGGQQGMGNFLPLTSAGLKTNWTKEAMKLNPMGTMGGRFIDHIFSNEAAKLISTRGVGGLHSDHNAVISEFTIPSHANGAQNIGWDNTLVNLHKGEGVLTEDQNAKFRNLANNIDTVASGGETQYNTTVEVNNPRASAVEIANKVNQINIRNERRKATKRTVSV